MTNNDRPICVVQIKENGDLDYLWSGAMDLFVIDERAPLDRVYQMSIQSSRDQIAALIGDSPVGDYFTDNRLAPAVRRTRKAVE
jgi:hypothetical protein